MKFFHVYNEKYFDGLVKNGLLNKDSGFKIQHVFSIEDGMKFNSIAKKGGRLHSLISSERYPFYIDRIAGGATYHDYIFDKELIAEYENLLGEWFLGFQLHESASNRRHDWDGILSLMNGDKGPYDPDILRKRLTSDFAVTPNGTRLYILSQGNPDEYAALTLCETTADFICEVREMFKKYMDMVNGFVLPCDSYYLFSKMQMELGMRTLMPEVGCQIPQMRIATALARGNASARGKLWGTYYETWIATQNEKDDSLSYSMPCYNNDPGNEWYLSQALHPDDFTSFGENGGSSRYLQSRIFFYSLMSGADYIAEEWGLNCSYNDMNTFELSPYGLVKKDFIDFSATVPGVKAITPFAIVLPREYECVQLPQVYDEFSVNHPRDIYMGIPLSLSEKENIRHIENVLKLIYSRSGSVYGNEGHVLTNSEFGDLFDIIYEDEPYEVFGKYRLLIDASSDSGFFKKADARLHVLESHDTARLSHKIKEAAQEHCFCTSDSLHWILSTAEGGRRFVSIFNNEGNIRDAVCGDRLIPEAEACATLTFKAPADPKCIKTGVGGCEILRITDLEYRVTLPPSGFAIIEC